MKNLFLLFSVSLISSFCFANDTTKITKNDPIQIRLDSGETPKEIIRTGVPMDSLYARVYQGGYIFYFFPEDTSGLVLGTEDLKYKDYHPADKIIWGCRNDLVGTKDASIGAGLENTMKISEKGCRLYNPDEETWLKSAATLCLEYETGVYDDWYLPSKDELHEAFMNISYNDRVHFGKKYYWTSTEKDNEFAWIEIMASGYREYDLSGQSYFRKFYARYVRPVRNFK